jgi:hypothetical protein
MANDITYRVYGKSKIKDTAMKGTHRHLQTISEGFSIWVILRTVL